MGTQPQPIEDRFWSKTRTEPTTGCIIWTAASMGKTKHRWGVFGLNQFDRQDLGINQRNALAHRVAFALTHGAIPEGFEVIHLCGNTLCVNPDHLKAGPLMERVDAHRESHLRNAPRGERAPNVKLTQAQVDEIRNALQTGTKPKEIAKQFAVSLDEIYSIKNGKAWRRNE